MKHNPWNDVFPEVPQSVHQAVQQALDTLAQNKSERNPPIKKRFPVLLVAAIAVLCISAVAVYTIQWNRKLAEKFGAGEPQQTQLVSEGAVGDVQQAVTENGLTVTAVQTLGDRNSVYLLLAVKAPEGIPLSDTNLFANTTVSIAGSGSVLNYSGGFLSEFDPTASPNQAENERYYELWLNNSNHQDWQGKQLTLSFTDLQADGGNLDMYTISEGTWTLSWALSYTDQVQRFAVNKTYDVNGREVLAQSLELSPLSMALTLGGDGLRQLIDQSDLEQSGKLLTLALTKKDGTALTLYPTSENWTDSSYACTVCFDQILNVEDVTGLTLTFPWESADNALTVPLP